LLNPEEEMYLNEIVKKFDVDKRNLARAVKIGKKKVFLLKQQKVI
jgi:hypothetical protein